MYYLYLTHFLFLVALPKTELSSIPVRSIILVGIFLVIFIKYHKKQFFLIPDKDVFILLLIISLTGTVNSFLADVSASNILSGLSRFVIQSYLTFIVTYYFIIERGVYKTFMPMVYLAALSAVIGFLQFMEIDLAWELRSTLSSFQTKVTILEEMIQQQKRPPGLSLFAITQGYLLLVFFSVVLLLKKIYRCIGDFEYYFVLIILFLGIVSSETRSSLVGILLCYSLIELFGTRIKNIDIKHIRKNQYFASTLFSRKTVNRNNTKSTATKFSSLIIIGMVLFLLLLFNKRITTIDQSASDKLPLFFYGLYLIKENIFGYGFGFDTTSYAYAFNYFFESNYYSEALLSLAIHNSLINFIIIYGIVAFVFLLIYLVRISLQSIYFFATIVAYLFLSFFHNAGLFVGDFYIFYLLALITWIIKSKSVTSNSDTFVHKKPNYKMDTSWYKISQFKLNTNLKKSKFNLKK